MILFALLAAVISLSQFFPFIKSHENTIVEFLFCYLSKWECKKIYIFDTISITSLQINPTMTISAAEKPGNVKKVQDVLFFGGLLFCNVTSDRH